MNDILIDVRDQIRDKLLKSIGLEVRRSSVVSNLLLLGSGILVGTAIGVLVAPKSSAQLRRDIKNWFERTSRSIAEKSEAGSGRVMSNRENYVAPSTRA